MVGAPISSQRRLPKLLNQVEELARNTEVGVYCQRGSIPRLTVEDSSQLAYPASTAVPQREGRTGGSSMLTNVK